MVAAASRWSAALAIAARQDGGRNAD